ncbi:MAG: TonB-dependent receptor [Cellvibrionaceae bacterium]
MYATERFAAGGRGRICFSAISFWLAVLIICFQSASIAAKEINLGEKVSFVIPQQRADLALTQFAEQANVTLVFPYDLVEKKTANGLEGTFTLTEALQKLLDGTGLYPKVSKDGQLSISTTNVQEGDNSMPNKNKLTAAVLAAMAAVSSAQAEESPQQIEEITVTGSHIRGADTSAANPVSQMTAAEIAFTGSSDVTDILNSMSVNSGAENRPDTFTSFYNQGTSNVNLRGLGLSSTLVLINGKRQTISGAKAQDGSVFVDTASIPAIALKRVEVLKEGAAAAYGSDAVAGVVNFITDDDFTGFKVDGSYHKIDGFGQNDKNFSMMGGFDLSDNTHAVVAASFLRRSNLRGYEKPELMKNANSGLGTAFLLSGPATVASGAWAGEYDTPDSKGRYFAGNPNCANVGGIPQGTSADADSGAPALCRFAYGYHYNVVNEEERDQLYGALTHDFENGNKLKLAAFYTNYEIIDNYSVPSLPNLSFPVVAAGESGNPFGVDVTVYGRHNPTLDYTQSRAAPRGNETFRLEGSLSGEFQSGWGWNTSLAYSENEYSISQPEMLLGRLELAMNGMGGESGTEFFNHFETDPSNHDKAMLDWLMTDFKTDTTTSLFVWDGVISGETDTGVGIAFGAQLRSEGYEVDPNDISTIQYVVDSEGNRNPDPNANQFTFLGQVNPVDESRTTYALFAEAEVPVSSWMTANTAIRYENLDTATSVDSKLALLMEATENLSFRASVSTSFREPSLSQMNADVVNTKNVEDPNNDGVGIFIRVATTGNQDLEPEEATNYNFGAIWNSESFEARADYWRIDYKNVITIEDPQAKVNANPNGPTVVRSVVGDPDSTLAGISVDYFNAASIDASGIDLEASYTFDLADSSLKLGFGWSHYLQYEIPGGVDAVGKFNYNNFVRSMPEAKGSLSAHWMDDNHSVYATLNHVTSYENDRYKDGVQVLDETIDSFNTMDVQYRYLMNLSGDSEATVSLGVTNLFDEEPPEVTDGANFSYDPKHHDPRGRIVYLKGSYQF